MAAPPPMFLDLFGEATQWDDPVPNYDALILLLGGVAGTATGAAVYDRATTMTGLANLARRSPTLVAFCPSDDNNYIYVGHSLSVYPSDPLNPLGFDGNIITLVGNDPASCQPVALPPTALAPSAASSPHPMPLGSPITYTTTTYQTTYPSTTYTTTTSLTSKLPTLAPSLFSFGPWWLTLECVAAEIPPCALETVTSRGSGGSRHSKLPSFPQSPALL